MFLKYGTKIKITKIASTMAEILGDKKLVTAVENKDASDLFFLSRLMTADKPNANFDFFEKSELVANHNSWVGRGIYCNHQNTDDVSARKGVILGSWIEDSNANDVHMVILGKINKECEPNLCKKIMCGIVSEMSMGCSCEECVCSRCGHVAHSDGEYCDCLKNHLGQMMTQASTGKKVQVYSINRKISGNEASWVDSPADNTAHLLQLWASTQDKSSIRKIASEIGLESALPSETQIEAATDFSISGDELKTLWGNGKSISVDGKEYNVYKNSGDIYFLAPVGSFISETKGFSDPTIKLKKIDNDTYIINHALGDLKAAKVISVPFVTVSMYVDYKDDTEKDNILKALEGQKNISDLMDGPQYKYVSFKLEANSPEKAKEQVSDWLKSKGITIEASLRPPT